MGNFGIQNFEFPSLSHLFSVTKQRCKAFAIFTVAFPVLFQFHWLCYKFCKEGCQCSVLPGLLNCYFSVLGLTVLLVFDLPCLPHLMNSKFFGFCSVLGSKWNPFLVWSLTMFSSFFGADIRNMCIIGFNSGNMVLQI